MVGVESTMKKEKDGVVSRNEDQAFDEKPKLVILTPT